MRRLFPARQQKGQGKSQTIPGSITRSNRGSRNSSRHRRRVRGGRRVSRAEAQADPGEEMQEEQTHVRQHERRGPAAARRFRDEKAAKAKEGDWWGQAAPVPLADDLRDVCCRRRQISLTIACFPKSCCMALQHSSAAAEHARADTFQVLETAALLQSTQPFSLPREHYLQH